MTDYSLLPKNRKYETLLLPFLVPYGLYVMIDFIPWLSVPWLLSLKFLSVSIALFYFRSSYRFGTLSARSLWLAIASIPFLMLLWALPLYTTTVLWFKTESTDFSTATIWLRGMNSVLLVPIFEELLCRVYLMNLFYRLPLNKGLHFFTDSLQKKASGFPASLSQPPVDFASITLSALLFMLGHGTRAWPAALLWWLGSCWLYSKTKNFGAVVLAHALCNLAIALFVGFFDWNWLWW